MKHRFPTLLAIAAFAATCSAGEIRTLVLDSGKPGPTLVIVAPEGGAGACGLDALRQLQYRRPDAGTLVLAEAVTDFSARPAQDGWSRLSGPEELDRRFPEHRTLVFREAADAWNYTPGMKGSTVEGPSEDTAAILAAIRSQPHPEGREWKAVGPASGKTVTVTTDARDFPEEGYRPALRQREFRHAAFAMMRRNGMLGETGNPETLFPEKRAGVVRVAVYDDGGAQNATGRRPDWIRAMLSAGPGLLVEPVGVPEILGGALSRADVLIMGGGKAGLEMKALGKEGAGAVRRYVRGGGGYVGICAGAYLAATDHIKADGGKIPGLGLLPVDTKGTETHARFTPLAWADNPTGAAKNEDADLSGGPRIFIRPEAVSEIAVWARFTRDEFDEGRLNEIKGLPAVVSGRYGDGKVLLLSTHCERRPSSPAFLPEAIRWCGSK